MDGIMNNFKKRDEDKNDWGFDYCLMRLDEIEATVSALKILISKGYDMQKAGNKAGAQRCVEQAKKLMEAGGVSFNPEDLPD